MNFFKFWRRNSPSKYNFRVVFQPVAEGGYMIIVPSLPGLVSYGRNIEEAKTMATDAIRCHCEGLLKDLK
jgi:predicted RNase H-like HicB family nuclease